MARHRLSAYTYARNTPTTETDPFGLLSCKADLVICLHFARSRAELCNSEVTLGWNQCNAVAAILCMAQPELCSLFASICAASAILGYVECSVQWGVDQNSCWWDYYRCEEDEESDETGLDDEGEDDGAEADDAAAGTRNKPC